MRMMIFWAGLLTAYVNLSGVVTPWAYSSEEASPAPKDKGRGPAPGEKLLRRLAGKLQAAFKRPAAKAAPSLKAPRTAPANRYEAPERPEQVFPAEDAER